MLGGGQEPGGTPCSRAGCRTDASWQVIWRNPRIHTADRRKVWLACDEHAEYLRDYLAARDFPVELALFTPQSDASQTDASQDSPRPVAAEGG
ncbi:MAG: hypothetical protein Q7T17_14330 [Microbacterium sp.]|uniref:hypothetical protein n=1 Tax=unclassified Microbacterium TaxID=2609290 RepID=UPI0006855DB2|nr:MULTISPECIES: hypothetical protein [unclassified Microbacterium]MDO8384142.1 hypothetical protein [Microbacterium sp.]